MKGLKWKNLKTQEKTQNSGKKLKTQGKNSKLREKTQNSGKKLNVSEDCPSLDLPSGIKKEPSYGFWLVFGIMGSGGSTF